MRWLFTLVVLVPTLALARPSVAIAPLDGDDGNKVAGAIAKALEGEASSVTGPKETGRAMDKLGLSGRLDSKEQKRLRKKLEVDVLIQGKVEDDTVDLRVAGKGITTGRIEVKFKSAASPKFRSELREALSKRLAPGKSDEDDDPPAEEEPRKKKVAEEDDEASDRVRKKRKKRRRDDDEDTEPAGRHPVTQAAIYGNAGVGFARRGLTYSGSGAGMPPPVGTAGPSARVDLEAYPGSMSTLAGVAAGFGLYGWFDRTFLVSIDVPRSTASAPITQQHFGIGARYRFVFGQHAVTAGAGYVGRQYKADRSGLGMAMLDMPDVDYGGVEPHVLARFAATRKLGVFIGGGVLLLLKAGQITKEYGYADTIAFDATTGIDVAFAPRYGMRAALELSQVGLSFTTPMRGVESATDRTIGLTATFEILY